MPFLLAPVLAQLITIGVHDRTETRRVVLNEPRYEAQTTPGADVNFAWRHSDLTLQYSLSLLVLPLESRQRDWLFYHTLGFTTSYRLSRTTFTVGNVTSFGRLNFQNLVLSNPGSGLTLQPGAPTEGQTTDGTAKPPAGMGGTTAGATPQQVTVQDRNVPYVATATKLDVQHELSPQVHLGATAVYTVAGSTDQSMRTQYPVLRATTVSAFANQLTRVSRGNTLTLEGRALQTWSSNGNRASTVSANETWLHSFDRHATSTLGAGLSLLRLSQDTGLTAYTIFPTALAGLGYDTLAARGTLSLRLNVFATPAPDQLRGTVDPRVGSAANISWTKDRFRSTLSGNTALSLAPEGNDAGALSGYAASSITGYEVTRGVQLEGGARLAKQQFEHQTFLPFSYVVFIAVVFDHDWKLNRRR